ncbi:MAG: hypothetical protein HQL32_02260 [Planctomycetes bacterium]|nr:hypothetical protein [Planctomycetota bacterium]
MKYTLYLSLFFFSLLLSLTERNWADEMETLPIQDILESSQKELKEAHRTALYRPARAKELYLNCALKLEYLIEKKNISNFELLMNTGNAFYFADQLGKSIYYYRHAEAYRADSAYLQNNLRQARDKRPDQLPESFQASWTFWLCFFSVSNRFVNGIFLFFWVLLFLQFARLALRKYQLIFGECDDSEGSRSKNMIILNLLALLFTASILYARHIHHESSSHGIVFASQVTARKGDAYVYQPSFMHPLHSGTEFRVLEDRGEWLMVKLSDGRECWLPHKALRLFDFQSDAI